MGKQVRFSMKGFLQPANTVNRLERRNGERKKVVGINQLDQLFSILKLYAFLVDRSPFFFESANEEPQWPMQILASRHKFPKLNETCRECNAESRTISASSLSAGKRESGSGGIQRQNRKSERERRLNMEYENYFFFQLPIQAHLGASIERCQCILIYLGSSYLSQHRLVVAYVIA